ncbi:MAG TPA: FtsX-like permease family protein [Bryobacteraceae bacterium]|jgi:putative ABC transport system permease protein|nr:FtsX-like permease family protein [Bryobacteraceae bacterium]
MILLRLLSWQYARKHLLRTFLTTAGIVLGTAVFVGMHTANQSVLAAFHQTVNKIAGGTQLQIVAGDTGFEESVLERVQAVLEVDVAVPVIEASANTELPGQGSLLILGVDMTGDRTLRDYSMESADEEMIDDPLVFLAQPDSIIVTDTFAKRNSLAIDSKLPMRTMEGEKQFTIRGIMKSGGLASAFGGNLAVMDIYAAQKVFGRGRHFDRIDLSVKEGSTVEEAQKKLEGVLGPGFQVESPSARGAQFESLARVYSISANLTSAFALFIGLFIIFNTFSIAVAQRRREIGILRMLGATQGQIRDMYLGESVVIGVLGSCAGIGLGLLIARSMASFIGAYLGEVYGVAQRTEEISANPTLLLIALGMGVATSLIAAVIPARNAARVDPVVALQKGKAEIISDTENLVRQMIAIVCLVGSIVCIVLRAARFATYIGFALSIITALLLAPTFSRLLSRLLRPALAAMFPVEGILAADSLTQAPRRTSGALSALMLSLALVVALGGLARASFHAITDWLDVAFNPDLFVTTSEQFTSRSFRFPARMERELAAVPGVEEVQGVRTPRVVVGGTSVMLIAIDAESAGRRVPLPAVAGRNDEMYKRAAAGRGVIASENFALLQHVKLGDMVEIPSPPGILITPVVGIIRDYSDQQGSLLMDRKLYNELWRDNTVNTFRLYLKKGSEPSVVKAAILAKLGDRTRLFVLENRELRGYILKIANQWFGIAYVQIAVAVLVAVLGIINTLTVSISDRRRELGIVQAIGGLRGQIRRMIWLEAILIGTIGLALGLLLGAASLYFVREIGGRDIAGIQLGYEYPFGIAALLIPAILGAAFASALAPAEGAVRARLVEALEYE